MFDLSFQTGADLELVLNVSDANSSLTRSPAAKHRSEDNIFRLPLVYHQVNDLAAMLYNILPEDL